MTVGRHLAQINIGRLIAPLDDPRMTGFVSQLAGVNALAEATPGFVWRLQSESGNATDIPYDVDESLLLNMSVWESVEALREFTYQSAHAQVFRDRGLWFEKLSVPVMCLWWVPEGHIPTVAEGRERLTYFQEHGDSEFAFSFAAAKAKDSRTQSR
jgi:hypothetical protein